MGVVDFILQQKLVLAGILSFFIVLVMVLLFIEKRISLKKSEEKSPLPAPTLESEVERLLHQKQPSETTLQEIEALTRLFMQNKYAIAADSDYEEAIRKLTEKNKVRAAKLMKKIVEYTYGGDEIDGYKTAILLTTLKKLIEEEKEVEIPQMTKFEQFMKKMNLNFKKEEPKMIEEKEEMLPIFEDIRNLKPVVIKPEQIKAGISVGSRKKISTTSDLDDLERIQSHISEKKRTII